MISNELAEKLYEENAHYLRSILSKIEKDKSHIDDILQETFCKAFQSFEQLRDISKFRYWISRIAVNQCYEYFRRKREVPSDIIDSPSCYVNLDFLLDKDLMMRALQELKQEEQELFIMKYFFDLDLPDIAGLLEITVSNASVRLHRARTKLKHILKIHESECC
ncbi:MAG: sigma-70 family RNA polymerase sigma factor [Gracilibacteraceae bacterium]|jgi:RNA polymerase sigma-70 factor (ECF subfamily)|nr:sigma-70 family RNA polymerase sigma factor [Gracilibacteraceae bacterium]